MSAAGLAPRVPADVADVRARAFGARATAALLIAVVHVLGVAAFLYPFFLAELAPRAEAGARAGDAPILLSVFAALLIGVAAAGGRAGRTDAKRVALLGVLAGVNAVLRLPGALGGGSLMFFLPVVCGYTFGASFGFMLGATSMAASALITGGVGPWLPFQMWALGWVGAGAALLRPFGRGRGDLVPVLALGAYAWIAGFVFGALTNLWFWPFLGGASEISWAPGIGAADAASRYWRFYLVTSLAWDSSRAFLGAGMMLVLGRPVLRLLRRYRDRLSWEGRAAGAALPPGVG